MKKIILAILVAVMFLLCGCGIAAESADPPPTPLPTHEATATPEPTPTPIPELTFPDGTVHKADETELDLTKLKHEDIAAVAELLKQMPNLQKMDLGSDGAWTENEEEQAALNAETAMVERPVEATRDLTWADLRQLQEAAPEAELIYRFVFYGRYLTTLDEEMDLNHSTMTDEGAAVREILPLMRNCKLLDMDTCGVSSESMAKIRDEYPEMDVVWRIWFGYNFSCRTDIELMMNSYFEAGMVDDLTQDLKYCTKVRRLDMGHNRELHDWSFLEYMPDLEICIITDSGWENLDMLSGCTKLEYLEAIPISHTYVDLSPLKTLVNLEQLNICGIGESDGWEALTNLTKLKRLWIGHWTAYSFPEGAIEKIQEALPNTEINTTELAAAVGSWRDDLGQGVPERYTLLREQMQYDNYWNIIPLPQNDPKYNPPWYN